MAYFVSIGFVVVVVNLLANVRNFNWSTLPQLLDTQIVVISESSRKPILLAAMSAAHLSRRPRCLSSRPHRRRRRRRRRCCCCCLYWQATWLAGRYTQPYACQMLPSVM